MLSAFIFVHFLALLAPSVVSASADCEFRLGFKTLRDLIGHDIVGECLENEHYNALGDSNQRTTGGLMAWRKADNWTAFTDGFRTWINGPNGLVMRLNTERFEWEADYAPGGGVATPIPVPTPSPTPAPEPTAAPTPLPPPPAALGLDHYYRKYLDADGLPIVASAEVPDAALYRAREIIDDMLAHRADLRATIAGQGVRVAVMPESSVLTDLPEFSDLTEFSPGLSWDDRTRGGGVGPSDLRPVMVIAEQNLLCYRNDVFPNEDIFVHEFAHVIYNFGVERQWNGRGFRRRLEKIYKDALAAGLWTHTYAGTNADEYWAEGVQSWFGLNDPPGYVHNEINTRAELVSYDPALAKLIREVFGEVEISTSCHETVDINHFIKGRVVGPDGRPRGGIWLEAWQGMVSNIGFGRTRPDGTFTFHIWMPTGSFRLRLELYAGDGCVGWYDGSGSITTIRNEAARVAVADASVEGIEIRLPKDPANLPQIPCY
ncbi:MAG: hypothetical protein OXQ27_01355 [Chloroflexota bacterium]|nr:hypothetical protein [Chloroflexota bacterium]